MFAKYYQDELAFLREMGAEFSRANPAAAPFLGERGADPDVERLLEGFAFLAGRLRQKLDDDLPELAQSLAALLWPHLLRPFPASTIVQFEALPQMARELMVTPRGIEIASVPVEETPCRFRTSADVALIPVSVSRVALERPVGTAGALVVGLKLVAGAKPADADLAKLRFFLHGERVESYALFAQLTRRVKSVVVRASGASGRVVELPGGCVTPCGFEPEEALVPYPVAAFRGYRLLQEFFAEPRKFLFLRLDGAPALDALGPATDYDVVFEFLDAPDAAVRVTPESVRIFCVPAVNLFPGQSSPLSIDHDRVEYRVRPEGEDAAHLEVYSVDRVQGWERGRPEPVEIPPFLSFRHRAGGPVAAYFSQRLKESVVDGRAETYLSFVDSAGDGAPLSSETAAADLTLTNRGLPGRLRVGDVCRPTDDSPTFARFKNITTVTPGWPPALSGGLLWRLISNLSLNYLSLASVEALREILAAYNLPAFWDRQAAREQELRLAGIRSVAAQPEERMHRGAPIRGIRVDLELSEQQFAGAGEIVLLGGVLSEFLGLYASLNSFARLTVRVAPGGELYAWPPRLGSQALV